MATVLNKKAYNLYIKTTKAIGLFIEGFVETDSWTLVVTQYNSIVSSLQMLANFVFELSTNGAGLSLSQINFIEYVSITMANSIGFVLSISENMKLSSSFVKNMVLSITMRLRSRLSVTMDETDVSAIFEPILAQLNALSLWDGDTLGSMDILTLEELDITEA